MEAFVAGLIAGYGIAIPVGAIAVLIVQVGIKCGFRCALSAGGGAATADGFYAALAVVGGVALTQLVESIGTPLRVVSALVLVVIAVYGLRSARTPVQQIAFSYPNRTELATTYARFFGLTIINPTTIVYFAAVVVGLGVASGMSAGAGVLFVLGAFIASLSWQALLAAVGAFAGRWLTPGAQRGAVVAGNVLILVIAVIILLP